MKEQFENYLIKQGYSVTTPSGNPSTVYDYVKRIEKVCKWENISWTELKNNIDHIELQYDIGGAKEDLGHKSHNAVINAIRRYREFVSNN